MPPQAHTRRAARRGGGTLGATEPGGGSQAVKSYRTDFNIVVWSLAKLARRPFLVRGSEVRVLRLQRPEWLNWYTRWV